MFIGCPSEHDQASPQCRIVMEPGPRRSADCITVLIVEDHPLFREGLSAALSLERDLLIVDACGSGEEALELVRRHRPDVVILDVNLPNMNGLQVTHLITADDAPPAVVVLTAYHDSQQVLHAMRAGASAYCAKDIHPNELVDVIRTIASGYYLVGSQRLDADGMQRWIERGVEAAAPYVAESGEQFAPLSPREMEILQYVTNGMSNKEIAGRLGISQQTVKNHMTSVLRKLNVQDRTQAAVTALRHGWVRLQVQDAELHILDDID